ncbi:23S rRNA (adenine(2503)-C(2))-methyltransferase RlmN [Candidatus Lariskella endosymbiont of Epinotia ramella]|uniref:23S rRNA (adenine(2503)-C(2))-methyltransferase RlmN n=1 Tax=Candidatus Lariskella endosymbiont of Epinotia ramella TaxID=3066224 RepID=UPI0030D357CB
MNKANFLDLEFNRAKDLLLDMQQEPFRTMQIWDWVYRKGVEHFDNMSNLPRELRLTIDEQCEIQYPQIATQQTAQDEVVKWLLKMQDDNTIETVFIPEIERGTLCISSQVGCTLTCKFCHTGTQKLVRNLKAGEIIGQVMLAKKFLEQEKNNTTEQHILKNKQQFQKRITNIVLMGMGEPLLNYENVSIAVKNMMHKNGLNISKNRITLSTSGIIPQIVRCAEELGINLAVSLHATRDSLRDKLVPINKKYKIQELIEACREYSAITGNKRITFEYVMLDGINDSIEEAKELVKLLASLPAKVNLIPFNPWPGTEFRTSSNTQIRKFAKILEDNGYPSPIRKNRGQDIMAACGQLKSNSIRSKTKNCETTS